MREHGVTRTTVVVIALVALIGVSGVVRGLRQDRIDKCSAAITHYDVLYDRMTALRDQAGGNWGSPIGRMNAPKWRSDLRELAVLMEQNGSCFSPEDRAAVEANYRAMTGE